MAWDDTKTDGSLLTADEWNAHVTHQKVTHPGANVSASIHPNAFSHMGANVSATVHPNAAVATSGSYVGNATANKAVAHGLGRTPKAVIIAGMSSATQEQIYYLSSGYIWTGQPYTGTAYSAVTAFDGTNFYVGNSNDYGGSANLNTYTYQWIAIG